MRRRDPVQSFQGLDSFIRHAGSQASQVSPPLQLIRAVYVTSNLRRRSIQPRQVYVTLAFGRFLRLTTG
jgi:hypothetical protein